MFLALLIAKSSTELGSELVVRQYEPTDGPAYRAKVLNGTRIGLLTVKNSTYIVVAEYRTIAKNFDEKTAIFEFTPDKGLQVVQRIDVEYGTDAVFW